MNRRTLLKSAVTAVGGAVTSSTAHPSTPPTAPRNAPASAGVTAGSDVAVAATIAGRVAGFVRNRIYTFKGIPYADTTAGANRFQPPQPPAHWKGIRSCRQYGPIAPQWNRGGPHPHNDEEAFVMGWDDSIQRVYRVGANEDCLRLNVWTPGLDGARRAVMIWIHGGQFNWGSSQEQCSYDGTNLAASGDVVVVSLNHRLNVFGFLNLADYGDQYAASANVGMLDIVAALQWVRDNIAAFGGDPERVTIFGQSGGGSKVCMLTAMPAAKGLFHRAIVQSGSMPLAGSDTASREVAARLLHELGISRANLDRLHNIPTPHLFEATQHVLHDYLPANHSTDFAHIVESWGFAPILDGHTLIANPSDAAVHSISGHVPMLVGNNLNEFFHSMDHPEFESMTVAQLQSRMQQEFGSRAGAILQAYRSHAPNATPFDLFSRISAAPMRERAVEQCAFRASMAPAYLYWFTWQTPVLDGRPRAFHGAELPFVFANTDRCNTMTGGSSQARQLARQMSAAWTQFAKTGDPNHPDLPHWAPFSNAVPTMIFDNNVHLTDNPDRKEMAALSG